jgi:hypothetical protein
MPPVCAVLPRNATAGGALTRCASRGRIRFMATDSEFRQEVRLSATDASRSFSKIMDQVEAGRRFLVRRHGRDVCLMAPPPVRGRPASECLAILRGRPSLPLDGRFGEDLLRIIADEAAEERSTWGS